jgi:hypothetical protein
MRIPTWILRVIILSYFFYKHVFYNPSGSTLRKIDFNQDLTAYAFGEYTALFLVILILSASFYYQIKQGLLEIRYPNTAQRVKFRGLSILVWALSFSLYGYSLINLDFSEIELVEYILYPYHIITFVSILAAIKVVSEDILLFVKVKQNERKTDYNTTYSA